MHLVNVKTLELEEHINAGDAEKGDVKYAILSHRWTSSEVIYKDFVKKRFDPLSAGYDKIKKFCAFATDYRCEVCSSETAPCVHHDVSHVWVDTCCIDKRSSAELSEAINSMWDWYRNAAYCVAYLADVHLSVSDPAFSDEFESSLWFTRGWTLQELLAPERAIFCSASWTALGSKKDPSLMRMIERTTGIESKYLRSEGHRACIAKKFSWASNRKTTRSEDAAYSLLGLLGVNMSLLYGEGGSRAFRRLQFELIAHSDDESIFAWRTDFPMSYTVSALARHLSFFRHAGNIERDDSSEHAGRMPYLVTNKGIQFHAEGIKFSPQLSLEMTQEMMPAVMKSDLPAYDFYLVPLNCVEQVDGHRNPCELIFAHPRLSNGQAQHTVGASRVFTDNLQFRALSATVEPESLQVCKRRPHSLYQFLLLIDRWFDEVDI